MTLPLATVAGQIGLGLATSIGGKIASSIADLASRKVPTPNGAFGGAEGLAKAKKAADDFEAVYLEQAIGRLMESNEGEGPLGDNGPGSDVWRSMLSGEYAKTLQKSGGVGISDDVLRSLIQVQTRAGGQLGGSNAAG